MDIQTVAVFGASGKLGRHVLGLLRARGLAVRALVHRTPLVAEGVTGVAGSIADAAAVRETLRGADAVVHLATAKEDPETFFDVSIRGTWNILEACRDSRVQQVILFSGDAAQGIWFYPQPEPIDENHALTAYPGYYAFSKVMEETMAQQYALQYGVPISILRASWVFEEDDLLRHFSLLENSNPAEPGHGFGAADDRIRALVQAGEERLTVLTDSAGVALNRHIVHVDDVMQAFNQMLGSPAAVGQSFNIAAPQPFNYGVAAGFLSEHIGVPAIEIATPYHSFEINIGRARSVLGYAPENDFRRMATRAIAARAAKTGEPNHA